MTPRFSVRAIPQFRRAAERLTAQHPTFSPLLARAIEILEEDPANAHRQHHIKKLSDIRPGHGQWRLRLGRFRFRYDIAGAAVELIDCGIRREDTYRER